MAGENRTPNKVVVTYASGRKVMFYEANAGFYWIIQRETGALDIIRQEITKPQTGISGVCFTFAPGEWKAVGFGATQPVQLED